MKQSQLIAALVLGTLGILWIVQSTGDRRLATVVGFGFLVSLVYFAKRKNKFPMRDSDLCLSLADILHAETPHPEKDTHVVFFWQRSRYTSVAWSGRFLNDSTAFSLSSQGQTAMTQLFDDLHLYYGQNGIARWNIAHFWLAGNRRRFDLKFDFSLALEDESLTLRDYMRRFM